MESKRQIEELRDYDPSSLFKEEIIWKLENYKRAYLSPPKKNWPVYEFCYRSLLRSLIDDVIERFRKEDRKITEVVEDLQERCDKATSEVHGDYYKLYLEALDELYEIVVGF